MGGIYTLLCLRSAELSKAFGKISVWMLLGYRIAENESERKQYGLRPIAA